jgi:hypothetical protein
METARSMLYGKKVPLKLWGEKVMCSTHIQNKKIPRTNDVTPFDLWTGSRPDVSYFRIFGSPEFVHILDETRRKLDTKAVECLLVGYCENSKPFRMWNPFTRKIINSRDIVFREEATYESGSVNEANYDSLFPLDEVTVVNIFFSVP